MVFNDRVQEVLLKQGLISAEDIKKARKDVKSGGSLMHALVRKQILDEAVLAGVIAQVSGYPVLSLVRLKIEEGFLKVIPRDVAVKYQVLPISILGSRLTLAMADPMNVFVVDSIQTLTGLTVAPAVARLNELQGVCDRIYGGEESSETFEDVLVDIQEDENIELIKAEGKEDRAGIEKISDDAPIIKLTDTIIQQSVAAKASDVFIEPLEHGVRIRYRVDGLIREIDRLPRNLLFPLVSRIKVISNLDISEHRLPQDGRFRTVIGGHHEVDFRVNVLPTIIGEKVCLRVLDKEGNVLDIEKLGFQPESLDQLKKCALRPYGMILSCGPTGSGKTTTLYSILKYVDSPEKNIVTVEDPVEYQMKGANQVNVKPHLGLTFATSLRSILRQDPNIIMIGEIRDTETLDIAVKAALTGHLVLSSLHTTTAAGSIIRMINMGIEPFLICSSLLAIIAQRLLRRVCTFCAEDYELSAEIIKTMGLEKYFPSGKGKLLKAKGCKKCFNSGYKGRVGITEVLTISPRMKNMIMKNGGEIEIKKLSRMEGMVTMREDAMRKVIAGLTTLEEVLRITASDEPITESDIKMFKAGKTDATS